MRFADELLEREFTMRVLVADDDDVFREAVQSTLERAGYYVEAVLNGQEALDRIERSRYDALISDIRMTPIGGLELLKTVRGSGSSIPFLLVTGFNDLAEAQEAGKLGVTAFLAKPFRLKELLEVLESTQKNGTIPGGHHLDQEFFGVALEDFMAGDLIPYDVFIRMSSNKYLKIAHRGENIPVDRARTYKEKGLTHLYLRRDDYRKHVSLCLESDSSESNRFSTEKKVAFLKRTSELMLEHAHRDEVNREAFEGAMAVVDATVSMVADVDDLVELLEALDQHSEALYAQSLAVSVYSVMVARTLRWDSLPALTKIAMAAVFHDIGKKEIDPALLKKHPSDMTASERKEFESHAERGAEILGQIPLIPSDVLQAVSQHHETCSGSGYPRALTRNRIHPFARLIGTIAKYCELAMKGPGHPGMSGKDALKIMNDLYAKDYDPAVIEGLSKNLDLTRYIRSS